MNALMLIRHLEAAGVVLSTDDMQLFVDAPSGVLTADLKAALIESKADTISFLRRRERRLQAAAERGFIASYSKEPGYISLHDPLTGEWHEFPVSSCLPSLVEEAKARARRRRERGA